MKRFTETDLHRSMGVILALVSTAALVFLLISLPLNEVEQVMAMAAGVALQACLYLFARSPLATLRRTALVLLVVSIAASAAFMEYAWQKQLTDNRQQASQQQSQSFQVQQLKREIAELNRQIDLMMLASEKDTKGVYTGRSDQRLAKLDTVKQQRQQKTEALQQLQQLPPQTGADSGSLQALLTGASQWLRLMVFGLLSGLIDYVALLALGMNQPETELQQGETAPDTATETDWISLYQQRISSGELGEYPSQRQLTDEVKQAYDLLKQNGVLVKDGQRFRLVTQERLA